MQIRHCSSTLYNVNCFQRGSRARIKVYLDWIQLLAHTLPSPPIGVMWSRCRAPVTIRAEAFWTDYTRPV